MTFFNHLKAAYSNSLNPALPSQFRTIAFPAISCGGYRHPAEEAAEIALSVCRKELYSQLKLFFYLFSNEPEAIWVKALEKGLTGYWNGTVSSRTFKKYSIYLGQER